MRKAALIIALFTLGPLAAAHAKPAPPPAADPFDAVTAAPDSHQVIFENARVRVLSVTIAPGKTEPVHTHDWPSIMRVEAPQPLAYITYALRNGKPVQIARKIQKLRSPAEAEWMEPEGPHAVQNLGNAEYRAMRIELKQDKEPGGPCLSPQTPRHR